MEEGLGIEQLKLLKKVFEVCHASAGAANTTAHSIYTKHVRCHAPLGAWGTVFTVQPLNGKTVCEHAKAGIGAESRPCKTHREGAVARYGSAETRLPFPAESEGINRA